MIKFTTASISNGTLDVAGPSEPEPGAEVKHLRFAVTQGDVMVEGDDLYSYQLVRMTGPVKLVEFPVDEKHVPNVFLSAAMVSDGQLFLDTREIVVPPVRGP